MLAAGFYSIWTKRYILAGIFVALSANCKLMGVLIIIAFFLHSVIYRKDKWKPLAAFWSPRQFHLLFCWKYFDLFITRTIENPVTRITAMARGVSRECVTIPGFYLQPSLDMGLPAVVSAPIIWAEVPVHPLCFKPGNIFSLSAPLYRF